MKYKKEPERLVRSAAFEHTACFCGKLFQNTATFLPGSKAVCSYCKADITARVNKKAKDKFIGYKITDSNNQKIVNRIFPNRYVAEVFVFKKIANEKKVRILREFK